MATRSSKLILGIALLAVSGAASATTLRASHQFPRGDIRDLMVRLIAKEAHDAKVGLNIQVYPGASLFKPKAQWDAMVQGTLDISSFALDYASGKVPAFSATFMPGLIRSQDRAKRISRSQFMKDIHGKIEAHGVMVLSDAWFAGGMAAKGRCIERPANMKGLKFRSAGPTFAAMWEAAGASVINPPSNEIYNAFQTGVVTGTDTSLGSFDSMRLYEVTRCLTAPGNNALWMMYEPILMSKLSFAKLNKKQQAVILKAGKDAQAFYEKRAKSVNEKTVEAFRAHKDKVVTLTNAEFRQWMVVAKKSSYAKFEKNVPDGRKLIDEALSVK